MVVPEALLTMSASLPELDYREGSRCPFMFVSRWFCTPFTGGRSVVSAEVGSLQDVITNLDINYFGIGQRLLDDAGLRRFMHVYLNGTDVRLLDGLDTNVAVGDSVTILPAAADGFVA